MLMSSFTGSLVTAAAAAAEVMGAKVALIVERTGCLRIAKQLQGRTGGMCRQ
jgi:hypothetical protein